MDPNPDGHDAKPPPRRRRVGGLTLSRTDPPRRDLLLEHPDDLPAPPLSRLQERDPAGESRYVSISELQIRSASDLEITPAADDRICSEPIRKSKTDLEQRPAGMHPFCTL